MSDEELQFKMNAREIYLTRADRSNMVVIDVTDEPDSVFRRVVEVLTGHEIPLEENRW
jgi:thymidylate kinase